MSSMSDLVLFAEQIAREEQRRNPSTCTNCSSKTIRFESGPTACPGSMLYRDYPGEQLYCARCGQSRHINIMAKLREQCFIDATLETLCEPLSYTELCELAIKDNNDLNEEGVGELGCLFRWRRRTIMARTQEAVSSRFAWIVQDYRTRQWIVVNDHGQHVAIGFDRRSCFDDYRDVIAATHETTYGVEVMQ